MVVVVIGCIIVICIELFRATSEDKAMTAEGTISNVFSNNCLDVFKDTWYFFIKPTRTIKVDNVKNELVFGAQINLMSDNKEIWDNTETLHKWWAE